MTIFICSLFLPKTVQFNLPGTPPRRSRDGARRRARSAAHAASRPTTTTTTTAITTTAVVEDAPPPSLFSPRPDLTPPHTPVDDGPGSPNPFANEDGIGVPLSSPVAAADDDVVPSWGVRLDQPLSRAASPPPAGLVRKARELGRRGICQPTASARSDSHDRVFSSAPWRVVDADQGNGGLRNAVRAAARDGRLAADYAWVGTLGMPTDALQDSDQQPVMERVLADEHRMIAAFAPIETLTATTILWPVFHYQIPDNPKSKAYEDHSWKYYVNVNRRFADTVVRHWRPGDVVWVHDYHLLLVPGMLRRALPEARIGFFLHVAFPSSEVFRCLAVRRELLEGVLGANLVGFQIHEYARHFLQTCSRLLAVEATPEGLQLEDRFVDVVSMAIGIDPISLAAHRASQDVARWLRILRDRYRGKRLIVARDKLDHVRGVRQKLLTYELFLHRNPQWRGRTVLIQVALSSGDNTSDLDASVSDIVTRVNSAWANLAYQPVVYLKQDIDYAQYLALLTIADVLMITSQREGMNLTSHEYVACQDGRHGSLILSEFTGTASLFAGNELSVNPWDHRQCADAILQALEMGDDERRRRWERLHASVTRHTGAAWVGEMLTRLDRAYDEQHRRGALGGGGNLPMHDVTERYRRATRRRLLMLDYEGTLVSWGPVDRIIPVSPQRTLDVLNELLLDERNVVFVMSGRQPEELDIVFRQVPGLGLIAENGCFIRGGADAAWVELSDSGRIQDWKRAVKPIMRYYLERTPGAAMEERHCSLLFHYGGADDHEAASRQASDCANHINDACEAQHVHAVVVGRESIVVEPVDHDKSTAAQHVLDGLVHGGGGVDVDFLMVAGDGREDEKVFRWANQLQERGAVRDVVTVSLGNRCSTEAGATLTQGVSGLLSRLRQLASLS
ncbi:hypothetical protein L249_6975 [Ophiocordyceps polyrhachis-furcata BCC 54312]|uniref:Uncharacterized protein n=1 Tax=Ophiocordyceps polyrhachis-furcata BCC 54312 TaxID=1330021 RepID=A0A367LJM2_9HYPO|nr:hypothetical protein L249_6975 [Ophiocordyceps polyrhachis-furcata BCC 54312]